LFGVFETEIDMIAVLSEERHTVFLGIGFREESDVFRISRKEVKIEVG
jgi:hypothetical protein